MKRLTLLYVFVVTVFFIGVSQTPDFSLPPKSKEVVKVEDFDYALFEEILLVKINEDRYNQKLDLLKEKIELKKTAFDQSSFYATAKSNETSDVGERAVLYGGTRNVAEVKGRVPVKSGADIKTYETAALEVLDKWKTQISTNEDLFGDFYLYIGVGSTCNVAAGKIFVSVVLGNSNSFAVELDKTAKQYISQKSYVLPYEEKVCRKCPEYTQLFSYRSGLKVEDGKVLLEIDDLKLFKKILKAEKDGLMVDIVQRNQFLCDQKNIIDFNQPHTGLVQKPIYIADILSSNSSKEPNQLIVELGELPKKMVDTFELNLVFIYNDRFCESVRPATIVEPKIDNMFRIDFKTLFDPKFVKDRVMLYDSIPAIMDRGYCWRSESKYYQNDFNEYNCLLTKLKHPIMKELNDIYKTNASIDRLYGSSKINTDTLLLLDMAMQMKILSDTSFDQDSRNLAYDRLLTLDLPELGLDNSLALARIYLLQKQYLKAIEQLDAIVFSETVSEDLLFSYISLSSLYRERIISGTFAKALKRADQVNHNRYCDLFRSGALSFQMFENEKVKENFCKRCSK